jgi:hypothetical protein
VAQSVGPEFKTQYSKKKNNRKFHFSNSLWFPSFVRLGANSNSNTQNTQKDL